MRAYEMLARTQLVEADDRVRAAERRFKDSNSDEDHHSFLRQAQRSGQLDDHVKGLSSAFIQAHKNWRDSAAAYNTAREAGNDGEHEQQVAAGKHSKAMTQHAFATEAAHKQLKRTARTLPTLTNDEERHEGDHLQRGEHSVEDHLHALARLNRMSDVRIEERPQGYHVTAVHLYDQRNPSFDRAHHFSRNLATHYGAKVTHTNRNGRGTGQRVVQAFIPRPKKQEEAMAFSVTNLRTGETVTSEDMARREQSRQRFLAEAERKRELRENAEQILYWSEEHRPQDYEGLVTRVPTEKIDRVIEALQSGENVAQMKGWAQCRICEANLGSADLAGNGFVWPAQAEHYVLEHGVWTPELDKLAEALESAPPVYEEREADKEGKTSCGVFLPLPFSLAKDFPDKSQHDDSEPHFTLLYMGDLTPKEYKLFVNLVRKFAQRLKPFTCDLQTYGEFLNPQGQKIPHMKPSTGCAIKMAMIHALLRGYIERWGEGLQIGHTYGREDHLTGTLSYDMLFKPHATLDYILPMKPYLGPKPTGAWRVNELECWGHERIRVPLGKLQAQQPLGLTREPMAIKYPMAVPDVVHEGQGDKIPGGLADKSQPSDFDPQQLAMGIKVEMEHTNSRALAREIAMDHLKEDPRYYTKLAKMEKQFEAMIEDVVGGSIGAQGKGLGGSSGDIPLDGTLPYFEVKKKLERKKLRGLDQ